MNNLILTFDIEEWYHANYPGYDYMRHMGGPERLSVILPRIIDALLEMESRATFFVLGEIAERNPGVVKMITDAGFPIGCHSHTHRLHRELSAEEIYSELRRAKAVLEDVSGFEVTGFRAPCFAIDERVLNLYSEILPELGFEYDSSLVPARFSGGGFRNMPDIPFSIGRLTEFPIGIYRLGSLGLPSTGAAFRMIPAHILNRKLDRVSKPFVLYLHPKDVDPNNPAIDASRIYDFLHRSGTRKAWSRFWDLLSRYHFISIEDYLLFNKTKVKRQGQYDKRKD